MGPVLERTRRWSLWPFVGAAIWLGFSGCHTDESTTTAPDPSVACHAYAAAFCAQYAACDPVAARQHYGDVETCTARFIPGCLANAGNGWPSGNIEQCAEQIKAATGCYPRRFDAIKTCEVARGTLRNGAPCDMATQCASLNCEFKLGLSPDGSLSLPVCGTCGPGLGPLCDDGNGGTCPSPQRCLYDRDEDREHCITPQPEGATCVSEHGCEDGLFCQRPLTDTRPWVCTRLAAAGVACTEHRGCDFKAGLRCVAGLCVEPTFVPTGASCDSDGRLCEKGICVSPTPRSPMTFTCHALLDDGSPCDPARSYECATPGMCRGGQCRLPGDPLCRVYW